MKIVGRNQLELEKEAILRDSNVQIYIKDQRQETNENLKGFFKKNFESGIIFI